MLKSLSSIGIFATVTAIISGQFYSTQAANLNWLYMGLTDEKEKIYIDTRSPHYIARSEATEFTYKIGSDDSVRINTAITEHCKNGEIDPRRRNLYWLVNSSNNSDVRILVWVNSNASKNLLKKVCQLAENY